MDKESRRVHRKNLTSVRHRCTPRYDNEKEHSVVTAIVLIVMLHRWDNSGSDSAEITMCTYSVTAMETSAVGCH